MAPRPRLKPRAAPARYLDDELDWIIQEPTLPEHVRAQDYRPIEDALLDILRDEGLQTSQWSDIDRTGSWNAQEPWLPEYDPRDPYIQGKYGFTDWTDKGEFPLFYPLSVLRNAMGRGERAINQQEGWRDYTQGVEERRAEVAPMDSGDLGVPWFPGDAVVEPAFDAFDALANQAMYSPIDTASMALPIPLEQARAAGTAALARRTERIIGEGRPLHDLAFDPTEFMPPDRPGMLPRFELEPDAPLALTPGAAEQAVRIDQTRRVANAIPTPETGMQPADALRYPERAERQANQIRDRQRLLDAAAAPLPPEELIALRDEIIGGADQRWSAHRTGREGRRGAGQHGYGLYDEAAPTPQEQAALDWAARQRSGMGGKTGEMIEWDPRIFTPERVRVGAVATGAAAISPMLLADTMQPETSEAEPAQLTLGPGWTPVDVPSIRGIPHGLQNSGMTSPPLPEHAGAAPQGMSNRELQEYIREHPENVLPVDLASLPGQTPGLGEEPLREPLGMAPQVFGRIAPDERLFPRLEINPANPEHIILLQDALRAAGFDPGESDGVIGPRTEAALAGLQEAYNGLPFANLSDAYRKALGYPTGDATVGMAQSALLQNPEFGAMLGSYGADNDYGPLTERTYEAYTGTDAPPNATEPSQDYLNRLYWEQMLGNPFALDQLARRARRTQ